MNKSIDIEYDDCLLDAINEQAKQGFVVMRTDKFKPLCIEKSLVDINNYSQDEVTINYEGLGV